jgi:diketogulonate reductase-like aldo/keto reductase
VNREIEADLLPYCESNKISVLAYYPLGHGKLAGAEAGAKMEAICKAHAKTPAQVALNWLVSGRNVFAIPRASKAAHVRQNLDASGWELKPEERAQLEMAFAK